MKSVSLLVVACFFLLVAACSSPSPSSAPADCFTGAYDVAFAAEANGDTRCPDLTADAQQWVYIVGPDGVTGSEPKDTSPAASNRFDRDACTASEEFTRATPAPGCTIADAYFFQLAFDAHGFTGTYRFIGCGSSGRDAGADAPPVVNLDCSYPVTGTKVR